MTTAPAPGDWVSLDLHAVRSGLNEGTWYPSFSDPDLHIASQTGSLEDVQSYILSTHVVTVSNPLRWTAVNSDDYVLEEQVGNSDLTDAEVVEQNKLYPVSVNVTKAQLDKLVEIGAITPAIEDKIAPPVSVDLPKADKPWWKL